MARFLETVQDPPSLIVHELPLGRAVIILAPDGPEGALRVLVTDGAALRHGVDHAALALVVPDGRRPTSRYVHLRLAEKAYRNAEATPMAAVVVLRDRDLLAYGTAHGPRTLFFDHARGDAQAERHRGAAVACPFCRQSIEPGDSAVCCPDCGLAYHEEPSAGGGCWSACRTCCGCGRQAKGLGSPWVPAGWPAGVETEETSVSSA